MAKLKKTTKGVNDTSKRTRWEDEDDFEKDLYSISDFGQPFKDNSPPSIYVRKARTKSIYDTDDDIDMVPTSCGRGRMMLMNTKTIRNSTFLKQQSEISKDIRLTSSGYGYCNDQIEHALNCNTVPPQKPPTLSNGATTSRSSTPPNEVTNRPLMALCDIVRNGGTKLKQEVLYKPDPDKPINLNSLKEFPKL
ncbi:hypothetical protein RI129_010117 [Pyrocoelia pectoralis]|uniref:Uncharacterized protein n=1 Tax=Pyrocoelia pectoralis TaxID=417401 RepID=A0AAN7ZCY9_9COLE